ncbi:permeases of the major facilitator superfamily [Leptolyngbya sp. Heron Island J]|uniref:DUF3120 domain-containing protein n=1 Tax=Leptolyngbya sp. Heron Island J TaxID=1385935 RepID=UPI0003B99E59|nr:DUF3120 domain-containing protein [Leptolyngbya sp. Heron Island J]ESA37505.1 permeases of the major facilitator superfamily [Leptolyngbya sp. Heron Island J]
MLSETSPQTRLTERLNLTSDQPSTDRLPAFLAAAFLVSVPVFIQAPLVRLQPWVSLSMTLVWLISGLRMLRQPALKLWGDLAIGFTWTWLAGSIYWGWLRENPYIHLPVEAIGLPIVLILIGQGRYKVGSYFYLGSLFGTAITDLYFYWVDLIPYWQKVMQVEPPDVGSVLQAALLQIENPVAIVRALTLLSVLVMVGTLAIKSPKTHWWAFAGAVLSTILVDALFLLAAILA